MAGRAKQAKGKFFSRDAGEYFFPKWNARIASAFMCVKNHAGNFNVVIGRG
jgi:hypothetical protein